MGEAAGDHEFGRGWPVLLSSLLGIGLGLSPLPYYTLGVFRPYLAAEFGWSTKAIMGAISVTTLVTVWAGPAVGWLGKRVGVRRVALVSIPSFALLFMAVALSNGSIALFYATWALVAAAGAGTLPITFTRAVNNWFDRRKGLALGLALMGTGLFGFVVKPLLAWLIPLVGWRGGYVAVGLLPLLIAFSGGAVPLPRPRRAGGRDRGRPRPRRRSDVRPGAARLAPVADRRRAGAGVADARGPGAEHRGDPDRRRLAGERGADARLAGRAFRR